jgi:hypothetical protein
MAGPKGLVLSLFVFALLGRATDALQSEHGGRDIPVPPHVSQVCFAYSEVATQFSVSVLCAVENAKNPRRRSSLDLFRLVWAPRTGAGLAGAATDLLIRSAIIWCLVCMDIQPNPGPPASPDMCVICDKVGRKNAVKIPCMLCDKFLHATCLKKHLLITQLDVNKYRRDKNYQCWGCSMPSLNDSFWSLPSTPRLRPAPLDSHTRAAAVARR